MLFLMTEDCIFCEFRIRPLFVKQKGINFKRQRRSSGRQSSRLDWFPYRTQTGAVRVRSVRSTVATGQVLLGVLRLPLT
jgi:hypothetical protein